MKDDLAIDGGLEDGAFGFEFLSELGGIDQVAVVADRNLAAACIDDKGLRVFDRARSGRRISHVADRPSAGQALEGLRSKDLGNETHSLVNRKRTLRTFGGNNARAFLATMLQRKKAIVHDARGVRMAENGEDTAFVGGFGFLAQGLGRWTRAGKWSVHAAFQGLNEPARPLSQASSILLKSLFSDSLSDKPILDGVCMCGGRITLDDLCPDIAGFDARAHFFCLVLDRIQCFLTAGTGGLGG